jgi:CubicO group peptidase (beta-lactamase class C family)
MTNGVGRRLKGLTYALVLLALAAVAPVHAEGGGRLEAAAPSDVGMSQEGLEVLGAAMRGLVDEGRLAGVTTVVARKGRIVHWQTYGHQDLAKGTPLTDDTIFRIYSMTKPVIGVALMTFYDEGRFELDDPVAKFIPEFADLQVGAGEDGEGGIITEKPHHPMTIRELVSHTGGFTYGIFARSPVDSLYLEANLMDRAQTLDTFIDKLSGIPLKSQPGTRWEYSVSVDVQGYLIQVLAGKPLEEVLEDRIFRPLGMPDTGFWVPPEKAHRLATMYVGDGEGGIAPRPTGEFLARPSFPSGGGGLVSTTMDYLRFSQMLANGGALDGVRILRPETVELMHTNQLPDSVEFIHPRIGGPGHKFGIDFALIAEPDGTTDHERARGEYWWYGIGGTWFGINPIQETVVIGMIQLQRSPTAREARLRSKRLVYEAIER